MVDSHNTGNIDATFSLFAHYKILAELGRGGMGCVYKAYDTKLERTVALKVLLAQGQADAKQVQRFLVEARAMAKLIHPNIVRLYEIGTEGETAFFTMDYIEGVSLKELIKSKKFALRKGIKLMEKISKAMYHAHQEGVIHRDLKPANIMVDAKEEPYVMDFGLAKMLDSDKKLTKTGTIMGTLFYMPPEQAEGQHREIDQRSDVYSLGAILYEIIAGKVPHYANATLALLKKITLEPIAPPSSVVSHLPKTLDYICLKALAKKKENRYKNAGELAQDLENFSKGKLIAGAQGQKQWNKVYIAITSVLVLLFTIWITSSKKTTSTTIVKAISKKTSSSTKKSTKKVLEKSSSKKTLEPINEIEGFTFLEQKRYSAGGKTHIIKEYRHNKTKLEFVLIPGGIFKMGKKDVEERPVHKVKVDSFLMSKYEVTQDVYKRFMNTNPSSHKGSTNPVEKVSWHQARAFCYKVGLFLPTEAQWEYACRAGTTGEYYWGKENINEYSWHSSKNTHSVGKKNSNAFGLYDMNGNVWEWCHSFYGDRYSERVARGGSYSSKAEKMGSAIREIRNVEDCEMDLGFRLVGRIPPKKIRGFTYLGKKTYSVGKQTNTVKEYRHDKTKMEFVLIPSGRFYMGSNDSEDAKPVHLITMKEPFLIAKYEVTQKVWRQMMRGSSKHDRRFSSKHKGEKLPVAGINWDRTMRFCAKLGLRLPTEAEWEYACRAGTSSKYYWGEQMDGEYLWYNRNSNNRPHNVGRKKENAFGLYDMLGNIAEWCSDKYSKSYYSNKRSLMDNPVGPIDGLKKNNTFCYRGGYYNSQDPLVAKRSGRKRESWRFDIGFRFCADVNKRSVNWTSCDSVKGIAVGKLGDINVKISQIKKEKNKKGIRGHNKSSDTWIYRGFTPRLIRSDTLKFQGGDHINYVITFEPPVKNPIIHLTYLNSKLNFFEAGKNIVKLSGMFGEISNSFVSPRKPSAYGSLQFIGTYAKIRMDAFFSGTKPDNFSMQICTR